VVERGDADVHVFDEHLAAGGLSELVVGRSAVRVGEDVERAEARVERDVCAVLERPRVEDEREIGRRAAERRT
jgi:hypothetical protein